MADSILRDKAKQFAKDIVFLCREITEYWLELLFETDCIKEEKYKKMQNECAAIRRMLISSLKTVKSK